LFQNILVVVDALRDVHPEFGTALQLAKASGSQLRIVDVVKDAPWYSKLFQQDTTSIHERAIADRLARLESLVQDCQSQGLQATCDVLVGNSSEKILAEASRWKADLIVRYAKGQHSLNTCKLGTTAQRLIRQAPCSLWIHRPQHEPIKTVVAAVDATPEDTDHAALNCRIVQTAGRLASANNAQLRIVYAWTLYGEEMLRNHLPASQFTSLVEQTRKEHVDGFDQLLSEHHVPPSSGIILNGDPSLAVPNYCSQVHADLLVCGTIARTGIPGLLLGNTIERIMQQVDCSILALPKS